MKEGWLDRLKEAVEKDGRSPRAISIAAKCGPNYLSEVLTKGKVPGIDRLMRLASTLKVSAAYLLTGAEVSSASEEMLALLAAMPAERQETMLALARQLRAARQ